MIDSIHIAPLNVIKKENGIIIHHTKASESTFYNFGELYISTIDGSEPKFWKKHKEMVCSIMVIRGKVKFHFYNDDFQSENAQSYSFIDLHFEDPKKLIIQPNIWFAFQSIEPFQESAILNLASIEHKDNEGEKVPFKEFTQEDK